MPILDLLYIYDATIDFAEERDDASMIIAHKGDIVALAKRLSEIVASGTGFRRCVFTSHGYPGHILLNGDAVDAGGLRRRCSGLGLHKLFPWPGASLYFNGCEVGAEPGGKAFVTAAAQVFLQSVGGTAMAMTSNGHPFPLPYIHKGHVVHFGGGIVSTTVGPTGIIMPEPEFKWEDPPNHRDNIGNKI